MPYKYPYSVKERLRRLSAQREKYANDSEWRERKLGKCLEWREANKEATKLMDASYYSKRKEQISKAQKVYHNKPLSKYNIRRNMMKRVYNLSEEDYLVLLYQNKGACHICNISFQWKKEVVDHCHDTGYVRGLLCQKCNTGLGLLGDTRRSIEKVLNYLEPITQPEVE
jgi:hypothetical protein